MLGILLSTGEYPGELHRNFLMAVCSLFGDLEGFKVVETCYEGPGTATISTQSGEEHFDIFMRHDSREGYVVHYLCECKFRSGESLDLESKFKVFLSKANKVLDYALSRYGEGRFCFLFIANVPFGIWENQVQSVQWIMEQLKEENPTVDRMRKLSQSMRILIIPHWFIKTIG